MSRWNVWCDRFLLDQYLFYSNHAFYLSIISFLYLHHYFSPFSLLIFKVWYLRLQEKESAIIIDETDQTSIRVLPDSTEKCKFDPHFSWFDNYVNYFFKLLGFWERLTSVISACGGYRSSTDISVDLEHGKNIDRRLQ